MSIKRSVLVWSLLCAAACGDSTNPSDDDSEMEGGVLPDGAMVPGRDAATDADADPNDPRDAGAPGDAGALPDAGHDGPDAGEQLDASADGDASANPDAGEQLDASSGSDAGDEPDAETDVDSSTPPEPPVPDMANTGFVAYGELQLAFEEPVNASKLSVTLSPARPAGLAVVGVKQKDAKTVFVALNNNHLPVDYTATVSGPGFSVDVLIPGENNGSRTAFQTTQKGNGNLLSWLPKGVSAATGREAGDLVCQAEADAAGLKGTFRALLSSDKGDVYDAACRAVDRTGTWDAHCGMKTEPSDTAPIIDHDGLPIVYGATGMANNEWLMPFRYHADGTASSRDGHSWTGSSPNARALGGCANGWTDATTGSGRAAAQTSNYLFNDTYSLKCDGSSALLNLICVQTGKGFFATTTLHERKGKAVFVTNEPFSYPADASTKLEQADTFCRNAAKEAGYATHANFVAWLSDPDHDAPCRLAGTGGHQGANKCGLGSWPTTPRWVRADGITVAEGIADLLSGAVRAPILFTETGARANHLALTETDWYGYPRGCSVGNNTSLSAWTVYSTGKCTTTNYPLICFER